MPEILDGLARDDPRAIRSRADLRRINRVMRQASISADLCATHLDAPRGKALRIVELGCGDGLAMLRVARRLSRRHPRADLTLLDMAPCVSHETLEQFARTGWTPRVVTSDVFDWFASADGRFDLVTVNLFLHH
ncbi:MAG: class I SAM-dependent methyltransferase, partial [Parerythrobacter sp.]